MYMGSEVRRMRSSRELREICLSFLYLQHTISSEGYKIKTLQRGSCPNKKPQADQQIHKI